MMFWVRTSPLLDKASFQALYRSSHGFIFKRNLGSNAFDPVRRLQITDSQKEYFHKTGFVVVPDLLKSGVSTQVKSKFEDLFAGKFETGVYPDEWHWREGISYPTAVREIVNGWKADRTIAQVVLSESLGELVSDMMGWSGARLAQDDVLWKPPQAHGVGFHQDSAYISEQFVPVAHNSVTVWIALDDADSDTGVVEYATGSHKWDAPVASTADSAFHGASDPYASVAAQAAANGVPLEIIKPTVPEGGCIIHHQNAWHGSGINSSHDRPRRALVAHLLRKDVIFRVAPPPDYIYGRYCSSSLRRGGRCSEVSSSNEEETLDGEEDGGDDQGCDRSVGEDFFPVVYSRDDGHRSAIVNLSVV